MNKEQTKPHLTLSAGLWTAAMGGLTGIGENPQQALARLGSVTSFPPPENILPNRSRLFETRKAAFMSLFN